MLQAGRSRVRDPMRWAFSVYLVLPAAVALATTQPVTEMSARNISGGQRAAGA
jgi:hypothetical protein